MINAVIEIVKSVAKTEVMPRYLKVVRQRKSDGSMCTEADIAAQAALSHKLQALSGHPVLGDPFYNPKEIARPKAGRVRLALRAVKVIFPDPFQKRTIRIEAPADDFMKQFGFAPDLKLVPKIF